VIFARRSAQPCGGRCGARAPPDPVTKGLEQLAAYLAGLDNLPVLSNRDYRWTNELRVKIAFLTLVFDDRIYMMVSETEIDHGDSDLGLIVQSDMHRFQALDLLLEFKYLSLKDLGLTGEQVRGETPAALAALPLVQTKLVEAGEQARRYGAALQARYGLTDLRCFAVVGLGLERVVWQGVNVAGTAAERLASPAP
jgi:hypothetical protein